MRWLLDPDILPPGDALPAAARAAGGTVTFCESADPAALAAFARAGGPLIYRGSVEAAAAWVAAGSAPPGVWANFPALRYSAYEPVLGPRMLNAGGVRLTLGELTARRDELLDEHGAGGAVFVRPDSAAKPFGGTMVRASIWAEDVRRLAFYDVPPDEPVVICRPRAVSREWRAVVAGGAVVAGCRYGDEAGGGPAPGLPPAVRELAESAAATGYAPDPVWVLDLCEAGDALHVLEVGAFACASLYACDRAAVVAAAHAALA